MSATDAAAEPADQSRSPTFSGFRSPAYTQVPDELFDELLPDLSGAELKTLLYIIRRTFGFKRSSDAISLSQMLQGLHAADGRLLDKGVGLSKPTLLQALRSLQAKNIIRAQRRRSREKGDEPSVYSLNVAEATRGQAASPPVVKEVDQGRGQAALPRPWSRILTTQQTPVGKTAKERQQHPEPPQRERAERPTPSSQAEQDDVVALLLAHGVTGRVAEQLVTTHDEAAIRLQVEYLAYRPTSKNPAGALVKAIREAWAPPPAWQEAKEHEAAVARQVEEEARRRAEEVERRRQQEALPPEERIHGQLQFWITGQRVKLHRDPTPAEIADRQAELINALGISSPPQRGGMTGPGLGSLPRADG